MGSVGRGTVVPELQRALGIEARALLDRFNLLKPLVEQMVISEAIARVVVSEEQLEQARLGLIQQRGFDGKAQWADLLDDQQLRLKSGSSLPLQVGMSLMANIKLRKVSYLQLLLGEFQDKAESLQRL